MEALDETVKSSSEGIGIPSLDGHSPRIPMLVDTTYRVYKRRWIGLAGLIILNISAGMSWLWFAPISVQGMIPLMPQARLYVALKF